MPQNDIDNIYSRLRSAELELEAISVKLSGLLWGVGAVATSCIGLIITVVARTV